MFDYPTGDPGDDPMSEEDSKRVDEALKGADTAGRHCGLHLEQANVAVAKPPPGHTVDPEVEPTLLMVQFAVGELAFTSRVLDPQVEDTNKVAREMDVDLQDDSFKQIRDSLNKGEGSLADLEDDD